MKLTDNDINNITKLANSAAALLEATGIAPNSPATTAAENLAKQLSEIASQMATTIITVPALTSDAEQAIRDHWKANQGEVMIMPLKADQSVEPLLGEQTATVKHYEAAETYTIRADDKSARDLANALDGSQMDTVAGYLAVWQGMMAERGLVVVRGGSDDLMLFNGAIRDELGAWEGTVALVSESGVLKDGEQEPATGWRSITARWHNDQPNWTYETDIPCVTFRIMDGEDCYCHAIVFSLADLK